MLMDLRIGPSDRVKKLAVAFLISCEFRGSWPTNWRVRNRPERLLRRRIKRAKYSWHFGKLMSINIH
jgi:hypothetical protein